MRKLKKIILALVILLVLDLSICLAFIISKSQERPTDLSSYQTILVLGTKIEGQSLATSKPTKTAKDRLNATLTIAQAAPQAQIIVSGKGSQSNYTEAAAMARYLELHGIAASRIIQENKATDTYENLRNSRQYLSGKTLIVTSDYHLERSLYLAKRQGYQNYAGYAAPSTERHLLQAQYYLHEMLGLTRAFLIGQ